MFESIRRSWSQRKLTDPKYAHLFEEHPDELVSFDCETTSLNVKEAEIISIGAVKIRGNKVLTSDSFYVLVKPEGVMQAANVTIHGLRPKESPTAFRCKTPFCSYSISSAVARWSATIWNTT